MYSEIVALKRLKEIEKKNGGLINGNFSFVAHENKIKVKRLRELYEQECPLKGRMGQCADGKCFHLQA